MMLRRLCLIALCLLSDAGGSLRAGLAVAADPGDHSVRRRQRH